jgi:3',5'-cyclic-AMP phosphodiesterase
MPHLVDGRPDRRTFLTLAGAAAASAAMSRAAWAQRTTPGALRLALLSDTHIPADASNEFRGFRPVDNLRAIAPQVAAAQVSGCLVCGDLARLIGTPEDYVALRDLLGPITGAMPVGLVLGNHDTRTNFLEAFLSSAGTAQDVRNKHVMVIERDGLRFVLLDSLLAPNVTPGQLGHAQRTWLGTFLGQAPPLPTTIVVHHTLSDADGSLVDVDRLFDVIRPLTQVKAILYGHSHRYHVDDRDGIQQINLPAVGYNFADSEPVGWVESAWTAEGVEMTLHAIGGNRTEHGQTRRVRWLR